MGKGLGPTHVKHISSDGDRSYAALKPGATWKDGKAAAETLRSVGAKSATPVRRK